MRPSAKLLDPDGLSPRRGAELRRRYNDRDIRADVMGRHDDPSSLTEVGALVRWLHAIAIA